MFYTCLLLTLACLSSARADWVCPTAEEVFPCQFVESLGWIQCNWENLTSADQIKEVLQRISPIIGQDVIFPVLMINGTPLKELPAGTVPIGSMKFESITINSNPDLAYISPDAFIGTADTVGEVSMQFNNFEQDENKVGWVFEFLSSFTNAWRFYMFSCGVTTIPDNALGYLPKLREFEIDQNPINHIGNFPFAQLPALKRLVIADTPYMTAQSIAPNAFRNLSNDPQLYVALEWMRNVAYLPEESIKPALESAARLRVGGESCIPSGCIPAIRFACDERMDWFCALPKEDQDKLEQYYCRLLYVDIFDYCTTHAKNATDIV